VVVDLKCSHASGYLIVEGIKYFFKVTPITGYCERDNEISVSVRKIFIDVE